jgi:cyclopropane-fatty-acyl-phospholipid synthase
MLMLPSLPAVVAQPLSRGAELARGAIGSLTWGPALAVAKPAVLSIFARIETGTFLLVDEPAGTRYVYGQKLGSKYGDLSNGNHVPRRANAVPRVELVVKRDAFWMRLFLFADMGFSEAYMLGDVECQDLTAFFQVGRQTRPSFFPVKTDIRASF